MSESITTLWINSEANSLLSSWNSFGTATIPSFKQGDSAKIEVHWVKSDPSGAFMEEIQLPQSSVIKVAIGSIAGSPTEGYFTYSYGGQSVEIPYDASGEEAEALINGLSSITADGGVSVSIINKRTFRILFNTFGPKSLSSCDSTTLRPSTNISVIRVNAGSVSVKEVQHLRQKLVPIAYSDSFLNTEEPQITITDVDSITKRISISPAPKFGTFVISNGTSTTNAISARATATDLTNALSSSGISSSARTYSVAKSGDFSWDIYRTSGTSETLSVTNSGIIGFSSKSGILDLNTIEVEDYLDGEERKAATLEIEYSYGSVRQTLYQGTVFIANDLIDSINYNPIPFPVFDAVPEAPEDGLQYARKDGSWHPVQLDGNNIPDYDNGVTYSVGNQVYYQGKLYRMIVAVGAAGYQPDAYPTYWESLSGSNPDLSNYVEKTGSAMVAGAQISFNELSGTLVVGAEGIEVSSTLNSDSVAINNNSVDVTDGNSTTKVVPSGITFSDLTTQTTAFNPADYSTTDVANATYYPLAGNPSGFLTSIDLAPYLTSSEAASIYQTQAGMANYATTSFVTTSISNLVGGAGEALDTLNELANALGNDANFSTTVTTLIGTKLTKSSNLSDLTSVSTARDNLGLGSMAIQNASSVAITGGTIDNIVIDGGTF